MFRLIGIATGTLMVGGTLFLLAKSPEDETVTVALPTLQGLSNQWEECETQEGPGCNAFQAPQASSTTEPARAEEKSDTPDAHTDNRTDKVVALEGADKPTTQQPQVQERTLLPAAAHLVAQRKSPTETNIELPTFAQSQPATHDMAKNGDDYELETITDSYSADKLFAKIDTSTKRSVDPEWQVFWAPFQTEIAARGFARHVAKVSGVAVQVIKQDVLKYVVAFPYISPAQRNAHAEAIEKAFGMKIKGEGDWT